MRVIVTGAAGFVGSHLSRRLVQLGHDVVGVDAFLTDSYDPGLKRKNLGTLLDERRFRLVEEDLRTTDLRPILEGADVIVNEAAMPGLLPSWDKLDVYASNNIVALGRLMDAARETSIDRFVHISTSSVYGRNAVGGEDQPTQPVSPYGVTKLAAENLIDAYRQNFGFSAMILRYFSVYGPGQRPDMAYHIFTEALIDGRPITVFGDGTQSRSNAYVDDCVDGTIRAIEQYRPGEVFNIAGSASISLNDALAVLADAVGATPTIEHAPRAPGDQYETRGDITKARDAFGYDPATPPEDGLRRQAAWHLSRRAEAGS